MTETTTFVPPTRFAVPGRIAVDTRTATTWQTATLTGIRRETPHASTFRLAVPAWAGHLPGQHLMLRLTAEDGYVAQRHYSIASAPDDTGHIELTLDHVDGGEVSGWFHTVARPGDSVEVRGPNSGFFAWPGDRPALLVGAGSGVVPLMSMLRHHRARTLGVPLRLLVSARSPEELIYAREYGEETTAVFTRSAPDGVPVGRMTAAHVAPLLAEQPPGGWEAYICGSNGFAEHASRLLVEAGQPVDRIRIERFG
ncbi:ferredoxin reductase [Streptomyces populi]